MFSLCSYADDLEPKMPVVGPHFLALACCGTSARRWQRGRFPVKKSFCFPRTLALKSAAIQGAQHILVHEGDLFRDVLRLIGRLVACDNKGYEVLGLVTGHGSRTMSRFGRKDNLSLSIRARYPLPPLVAEWSASMAVALAGFA